MKTINFAHASYQVDRALVLPDGVGRFSNCPRLVCTEIDAEYPAGQEWRARVMFTRVAEAWTGKPGWYYSSNNVGSHIANPEQVAAIDAAWEAVKEA